MAQSFHYLPALQDSEQCADWAAVNLYKAGTAVVALTHSPCRAARTASEDAGTNYTVDAADLVSHKSSILCLSLPCNCRP
jgi:hypothetical protein